MECTKSLRESRQKINVNIAGDAAIKIALVGNIANNFFREAVSLRKAGYENVNLYFAKNDATHSSGLPESDNPRLEHGYPSWIKTFSSDLIEETRDYKNRNKSEQFQSLVSDISESDLVLLSGGEIVLAPWIKSIRVFRVTGGDFTLLPFPTRCIRSWLARDPGVSGRQLLRVSKMFFHQASSYRRGINSVDYVAMNPHIPYIKTAPKLGISQEKIIFPPQLSINGQLFRKIFPPEKNLDFVSGADPSNGNKVFFLGSRFMPTTSRILKSVGDWKASERAIYGFAKFLKMLPKENADSFELWIPDTEMAFKTSDARKLSDRLGISGSVKFVSGSMPSGFTRQEMIQIMSHSFACLDDFGVGWFGSFALESLACECPLITWVTPAFLAKFPESTILTANTASGIAQRMWELAIMPDVQRTELGRESRKWAISQFGPGKTSESYVALIAAIESGKESFS